MRPLKNCLYYRNADRIDMISFAFGEEFYQKNPENPVNPVK
jgi:hypothetical protein